MTRWRDMIRRGIKRYNRGQNPFTPATVQKAKHWATCAVGEEKVKFPEVIVYSFQRFGHTEPSPNSWELDDLGSRFYANVQDQAVFRAADVRRAIISHVRNLRRAK